MDKHSPGPWTACPSSTDILIVASNGRIAARTSLCTKEDEANAALAASAPTLLAERDELLAALKREHAYTSPQTCDICALIARVARVAGGVTPRAGSTALEP